MAVLFDTIRVGNRALDAGDDRAAATALRRVRAMLQVLGLDPSAPEWAGTTGDDLSEVVAGLVELILEQRSQARARKDWANADAIRDRLAGLGLKIADTAEGVRWSR